jgi:histidine triad (HIT) family protein
MRHHKIVATNCLFCRIVSGEEPAEKVFVDEYCVAFLDNRPLFAGHCLLVPREHIQTLGELPPAKVGPLFEAARVLSLAVEEAMDAEGTFVAINNRVSQSVPHLHIHVVPRKKKDGLRGFFWPRTKYGEDSDMRQACDAIRSVLDRLKASHL